MRPGRPGRTCRPRILAAAVSLLMLTACASPAPQQDAGCEGTGHPDRLELDVGYDLYVVACRTADGTSVAIRNVTTASTLIVYPVQGSVRWQFSTPPAASLGEIAVAEAVPAGSDSAGNAVLPPGVTLTVQSADLQPFTLNMAVDLYRTSTAMAATTVGDWVESKVPQPLAAQLRDLVHACALDVGRASQLHPGAQWQDLLRQAFSTGQSCAALYAEVAREIHRPPPTAVSLADEAADLARASRNTSQWDEFLKAARQGLKLVL